MRIVNVHRRFLPAPAQAVGALLDRLATDDDRLWPWENWSRMRLDRPLAVGAEGGHGRMGYRVEAYDPGRRVRFRFLQPPGFEGWHEFEVTAEGEGSVIAHTIRARARGRLLWLWLSEIRHRHDALIEECFDKAETELLGRARKPHRRSLWVRTLRRRRGRRPSP